MKIIDLVKYGVNILKENKVEDEFIKARTLLAFILKVDKKYLLINENEEVSYEKQQNYKLFLQQLVDGRPIQYITHKQEFMGNEFYVDENVLIPQPDTEILVEEVIKDIIKNNKSTIRILDLCTGSGAIAISIMRYFQTKIRENDIQIKMYASDISSKALKVAQKNAKINNVDITFIQSDMFKEINNYTDEKFDIIVSNPPYIEQNMIKTLQKDVQNEPYIALNGGVDGLDFYRIIAKQANKFLKKDGVLFLEIGYNQGKSVIDIFKSGEIYISISMIQDLAQNDRVLKMKLN